MRWELVACIRGDIIRVNLGNLYHYGIYVSDDEIIQFGYPPVLRNIDKDRVVVVATDIKTFACEKIVEVGYFVHADHQKRFKPEIVVENARNRMGEGGYNVIHNNCEHFAFECYCGIHYSSQEEEARAKWSQIGFINAYFFEIPKDIKIEELEPKEVQSALNLEKDEEVKKAKYVIFLNLKEALQHTLAKRYSDLSFKLKKGKLLLKECYFSYAFSDTFGVIVTSNKPIGVDVENYLDFAKYHKDDDAKGLYSVIAHKNEGLVNDIMRYFKIYTEKKSVLNLLGKENLPLKKVDTTKYPLSFFFVKNTYYLVVCGDNPETIRFFSIEKDKISLYKGKIEE